MNFFKNYQDLENIDKYDNDIVTQLSEFDETPKRFYYNEKQKMNLKNTFMFQFPENQFYLGKLYCTDYRIEFLFLYESKKVSYFFNYRL